MRRPFLHRPAPRHAMKSGVTQLSIREIQMGLLSGLFAAAMLAGLSARANAQNQTSQPEQMPSGQYITPMAPKGATFSKLNPGLKDFPDYTVGQAVKTVISPDGNTLLILTSGFNRLN